MDQPPRAQFLSIPPEIREEIYRLLLSPDANRTYSDDDNACYNYASSLQLFHVSRQVYGESRKIFRDLNTFVRIETPWPEAQQHVASQGHVPILVKRERAKAFDQHSLIIQIDAPEHSSMDWDTQRFVILLDDLAAFCKMWFYADLTNPSLNEHLRLRLELRDPYAADGEEQRVSRTLQRKMFLPFGNVKGLNGTNIAGDVRPIPSIEQDMRKLQAEPHSSPEHCLREGRRLKFEGNAKLASGNYAAALELYKDAWRAIHVVFQGRERHIHADRFFARELTEEPFKGKNGQAERLVLRVQLVANTCQVYLKQEEYEQCRYWGMRSIGMLREAMGAAANETMPPEDEAVLQFPAANEMGMIYFRTAVAYKELGDENEARQLLRVARLYLPRDENVKREVAATALK